MGTTRKTRTGISTAAATQMLEHSADAAALLRALGNEQRLAILCGLLDGPLSVSQINERVDLSQSALSQHLAVLRESELVATRKDAQTVYYSLPDGPARQVLALLQKIFCPS